MAELRSSAGRLEKQVGDRDGGVRPRRGGRRGRLGRFVETNGRNGKEKGAVDTQNVVRTALPPRGARGRGDGAKVVACFTFFTTPAARAGRVEHRGAGRHWQWRSSPPLSGSGRENAGGVVSPATAAAPQRRADELAAARQLVKALEDDAEELRDGCGDAMTSHLRGRSGPGSTRRRRRGCVGFVRNKKGAPRPRAAACRRPRRTSSRRRGGAPGELRRTRS